MNSVLVFRHVPHEGLGAIADALRAREVPYEIIDVLAEPPREFEPEHWSGLVVMGGPMNVDQVDRYPALADEVRWMRQAVDANLPVLGVCLGSQLLAKALGVRVYPNRIKEIGWYDVELMPAADSDPMFDVVENETAAAQVGRKISVFQWHGDTFDLPEGAVQLARSPLCENQAFRYDASAYGLQFHLEVTAEMIDDWLRQSDNCGELAELDYIDPAAIRRDIPLRLPAMEIPGRKMFDRFAVMCQVYSKS